LLICSTLDAVLFAAFLCDWCFVLVIIHLL
jgi:hypothetical protein